MVYYDSQSDYRGIAFGKGLNDVWRLDKMLVSLSARDIYSSHVFVRLLHLRHFQERKADPHSSPQRTWAGFARPRDSRDRDRAVSLEVTADNLQSPSRFRRTEHEHVLEAVETA
jgi:hypothetical protein